MCSVCNVDVSVVIPLYNKAGHIARAVESVLAQTHRNFDLIVVDDGSTDGSAEVVRRCGDGRIRLVSQENAGVSAARNRGAVEAKDDLVAFLDADDQWLPDFLATALKLRDRFPQAAVWATTYAIVTREGDRWQPEFPFAAATNAEGGLIDYFQSPGPCMPLHASAVMLRKDALVKAGGFPIDFRCGEDWDTWIRLALRYPIAWSPQAKAVIYENAENRTDGVCYTGVYPFVRSLRDFLCEAGPGIRLGEHVYRHVAQRHMRLLLSNLLVGDRRAFKQILDDCRGSKAIRRKCLMWRCLYYTPHRVVVAAWQLRQRLSGRVVDLPLFRNVRRP